MLFGGALILEVERRTFCGTLAKGNLLPLMAVTVGNGCFDILSRSLSTKRIAARIISGEQFYYKQRNPSEDFLRLSDFDTLKVIKQREGHAIAALVLVQLWQGTYLAPMHRRFMITFRSVTRPNGDMTAYLYTATRTPQGQCRLGNSST